jgi:hypothetical protein
MERSGAYLYYQTNNNMKTLLAVQIIHLIVKVAEHVHSFIHLSGHLIK